MARLPALIDAIAEHDGRGRPTIFHIARRVRDAGLIASKTRGAGAAAMTYRDAAILLMAVNGDINPLGSVAAAQALTELQPAPPDKMWFMQREDLPDHFDWLREPLGFAETLERLIEHAPDVAAWEAAYFDPGSDLETGQTETEFSIRRSINRLAGVGGGLRPSLSRPVRVVFYVPGHAAEVHLGWVWDDLVESDAFHEYYVPPPTADLKRFPHYDTLIPIEVGTPMLLALHNAVNARPPTRGPASTPPGGG
ncbi:MAG: hypothetical protein ACK4VY_02420 [Brevundimonas sp.]